MVGAAAVNMVVKADLSALKQATWREFSMRFAFGGAMTVLAGLIAKHYGPELGGLFLAFPAIAPASVTLLDQQVKEQRQRAGMEGHTRGRKVAALDMFGTLWGSAGLIAFGLVVWKMGPLYTPWAVLPLAMIAWFAAAFSVWELRRLLKHGRGTRRKTALSNVSVRSRH
jgi:hypothetical protein